MNYGDILKGYDFLEIDTDNQNNVNPVISELYHYEECSNYIYSTNAKTTDNTYEK